MYKVPEPNTTYKQSLIGVALVQYKNVTQFVQYESHPVYMYKMIYVNQS